jgi:protein-tyrosine phosphatase
VTTTRQVLFVCTGNVFRSLTAEYALRAALGGRADIAVASAGTEDYPHLVRPEVSEYLLQKGFDVRAHRRRTLARDMMEDFVIAMSLDHRDFIRRNFGKEVPVFLECCGGAAEALLDLEEAVSDYRTNLAAAVAFMHQTIDRIVELTPRLAARIDTLIREEGPDGRAAGASLKPETRDCW